MNKNVQILSIEAKDLVRKNYTIDTKKIMFKGSFDDSIEIDKLSEMNKSIIKLNKKKNRFYSTDIITVTFKYSCNDDNPEEYSESIFNINQTLRILTAEKNNTPKNKRTYINAKIKETKELLDIAKRNIKTKDLRDLLYTNGFKIVIDGKEKHFVRYKRSSGSARVGKCLFINKKYHKKMIDWSFADIPHKIGEEMDCSSMEAYISLPTSSCINRMVLYPENILLVDDKESVFKDTVMAVKSANEVLDEDGNVIDCDLHTEVEEATIKNKIWDGESLLDKSKFEELGYEDKCILQIRNRFFKGIGVNTNIQQFFKDNNITEVNQLNGKTIAKSIEDIKLITTPSSVKYLKYGTFEKWLDQIVPKWGVCKYEKPQKHFNGMVQTHYQLINTLGMNKETTREFLGDTLQYIKYLKTDVAVFKHHLGLNTDDLNDENIELRTDMKSTSDFILSVLNINDDFVDTKICRDFRNDIVSNYIKNVRKGHVLVNGNYSVVISCPYELLSYSIGKWNEESSVIKPFECVSSKFEVDKDILGVRSPQPTMSNVCVFKNKKYEVLDKYFNTQSKEVVFISSIGNNVFELQSSMDVDGDAMELTDNKWLVEACKKLDEEIIISGKKIKRFLVPTDFTSKAAIKRKYTPKDLADVDIKCSQNLIGEIINLAQKLNSVYWDKKSKGASEQELFELYKDICQLDILSCIEIDRCKKFSPVNATKEIKKIANKHYIGKGTISRNKIKKKVGIRPYFFKFLDGGKDYKFEKFNCGMDYLEIILDEECKKEVNKQYIALLEIIEKTPINKNDKRTTNKLKKYIKELKEKHKRIWNDEFIDNKWEMCNEEFITTMAKINKLDVKDSTIYLLLKRIDMSNYSMKYEEYKLLSRRILRILYQWNRVKFLKMIKIKNKSSFIIKDDCGDIKLYGITYKNNKK